MLTITQIAENTDRLLELLAVRGGDFKADIHKALELDDQRRALQFERDEILARSNKLSKEIGQKYASGQQREAVALKAESGSLKERSKGLAEKQSEINAALRKVLLDIPNRPHKDVPAGKDDSGNVLIREGGTIPEIHKDAVPHWDLASKYDLIDFEMGVKLAGAGFPTFKGKGARLQRALIAFFLDRANEAGYTEYQPSLLVNETSGLGTGSLPDKEGQMYKLADDELYLVPTAEVPLTNIYRDVILKESDFPVKMTAYTSCFRREAGSYGKHVRGLNRLHQFEKVEIVHIEHPDRSYETLDEMVAYVESIVNDLGLPYRIVRLCGGDLGFTSAMTYDFEVWSAAQKRWLEISSVSNFESFQTNRLQLRYTDAQNKKRLAHTLNGSALALPRVLAALLENNQDESGINIPEILQPYTGFDRI